MNKANPDTPLSLDATAIAEKWAKKDTYSWLIDSYKTTELFQQAIDDATAEKQITINKLLTENRTYDFKLTEAEATIEEWKDAYENLKSFCVKKGIDINVRN
jgi:hypothetical protein